MVVWFGRAAWSVAAVLLLWLIAWAAVPPLVKWQTQSRLTELLGRTVTIGEVRFKPWTLELTLSDLAVAGAPDEPPPGETAVSTSEPLLHIARLHANLSISSVLRLVPVVQALEIDAPQLRIARLADGRYDIDDVLARIAAPQETPAEEDDEPAQFALYNLQLRDGHVRFDDRPVGQVHEIQALQLSLPFASSLPAEVELEVEPHLSFRLNGTPFDSGAQATPFAQTNEGALTLTIAALDVGPYLGYLPASLPVRLARGTLSADLALQFAVPADGTPSATLRGSVSARDVAVNDTKGAPLFAWRELQLALGEVQPFARRLAFESLRIDGAQFHVARDAAGRLNVSQLAGADTAPAAKSAPAARRAASAASAAASGASAPAAAASPWRLSLASLALNDARVLWNDAAVSPAAALQLDGVAITAKNLQWPVAQPMPLAAVGSLRVQRGGAEGAATLSVDGQANDHEAKLDIELAGLNLQALAPYLAQALTPRVDGKVSAKGSLDWSNAPGAERLQLVLASATLDALQVRDDQGRARRDDASLDRLALTDVNIDVPARRVVIGSARLAKPFVAVTRDAQGQLNLAGWLAAPESGEGDATDTAEPAGTPWRIQLRDFTLEDGRARLTDASARHGAGNTPLRLELDDLAMSAQNLAWPAERDTPPAPLTLSARLGSTGIARDATRPAGTLRWKGELALDPLLARGDLRVTRVPVHAFAPYFAAQLPVALVRAEAGYTGRVELRMPPAGLSVSAQGDVLLGDVQVNTLADPEGNAASEELLNWQSLALKQVKLALAPEARPQVDIAEVTLSDFYSRLIITEEGHFNLQDVGRPEQGDENAENNTAGAAAEPATATSAAAAASAPAAAPAESALPLDLRVGLTRFVNGRIDFADHFVEPNYSAALTELHGELGTLQSGSREMASLTVRGRAAGTALLEITGQLNPMVTPPAMDIRARATGLELAPLSPYAGKYAGYAIERGKLSADVSYKIDADGRLEAKNQIVINQLSFGERIESPSATKLPVQLAVALLKDRNGVIDINLPVSGNLQDPEFSLGGLIARLVGNLLLKALTAPFSLLMGGGGGADDLSVLAFKPGTTVLAQADAAPLDKVAKALTDRPALKMTITGSADPVLEREAYQRRVIEERLMAEHRRAGLRAGAAASAPAALSGEERERAITSLYRETELPDKPRNRFGFARRLPVEEMEALLRKHVPVTDDAMRELALQRGLAVRDALLAKGLPGERIFLAAPELHGPGEKDKESAWTPRVELNLSVK